MYKNQFDKEVSAGLSYKSYLFWGACDYLTQKYSQDTANSIANGEDILKVYFDDYNFKDCEAYLSQSSLFSPVNVLVIKTVKKIPKKELDALVHICNTNPDSYLIVNCMGQVDFKTMAKSFTKKTNSCEVRFFQPTDQEAVNILYNQAQKLNINCHYPELQYLYNMHQKDLSLSINDLTKLSILDTDITLNIVNQQCFGMGAVNLDTFFTNLFTGKPINKDLYMLLEEGMNEINLVAQATGFVQQLFNINSYIKLNGSLNIIEIWGYPLPKNIANQRASIAQKFTLEQFVYMLDFFQELELDLKSKKNLDINSYTQAKFRMFAQSNKLI